MGGPLRRLAAAWSIRIALPLLAACASNDGAALERIVTVPTDAASRVVYAHLERDLTQSLVADPRLDPSDFYSSTDADPGAKLVSVDQMQAAFDVLGGQGLFAAARPEAVPGAVAILAVEAGDQRWVWSRHPAMTAEELRSFLVAMQGFQNLWNAVDSFHAVRGRDAVSEPERIRRANEAARQRGARQR